VEAGIILNNENPPGLLMKNEILRFFCKAYNSYRKYIPEIFIAITTRAKYSLTKALKKHAVSWHI